MNNAGTAKIIVTGKGNYTSSVNGSFKINPASIANAKIALNSSKLTYTGKKLVPTVKTVGGKR